MNMVAFSKAKIDQQGDIINKSFRKIVLHKTTMVL